MKTKVSDDEQWKQISEVLTIFFKKIQDDEKLQRQYQNMFDDIEEALDEYNTKKMLEN